MRGRRAFLALVFLGAAGAAAYWLLGGVRLREPLVENAPERAAAYARVDVRALLRSPWWRRFVTERGGDQGLQRMRERCGIEPSDQLHELAAFVGADGPRSLDHVTFLARGPFEHEALGGAVAVHLRGVDQRHPEIDTELQGRDFLRPPAWPVAELPGALSEHRHGRARDFRGAYLLGAGDGTRRRSGRVRRAAPRFEGGRRSRGALSSYPQRFGPLNSGTLTGTDFARSAAPALP